MFELIFAIFMACTLPSNTNNSSITASAADGTNAGGDTGQLPLPK